MQREREEKLKDGQARKEGHKHLLYVRMMKFFIDSAFYQEQRGCCHMKDC